MELIQLKQLVTIAHEKVLSHAADKLNISQPALSRSIQHLEEEFGISLFDRKKNSMVLNEAGALVVEQAEIILADVETLRNRVSAFLKNQRLCITVVSCAPAPLWKLSAELPSVFPNVSLSTSMPEEETIVSLLLSEKAHLAIVRTDIDSESIGTVPLLNEQLFMQIPLTDPLSKKTEIHFSDLAGKEIKEYTKTGFWHNLHREFIPDATYIEYDDMMVYANVVKSQSPLTFVTELGNTLHAHQKECVVVPIVDEKATAHYRLAFLKKNKERFLDIIEWAEKAAQEW
ncbi:MAG: LysR family transcriptional regulator [Treponema sp.]|nr:LysR family transcriptional regulator [Treponema sp.]